MKKQSWKVVALTMETRTNINGTASFWGFRVTLHRAIAQGTLERQEIRVWVEKRREGAFAYYSIWRSVQNSQQRPAQTEPMIQMLFETTNFDDQIPHHLRELLYLWTNDLQVEEQLQPLLQDNLCELRKKGGRQNTRTNPFFASAIMYLYRCPQEEESTNPDVLLSMERASTWDELRLIMIELPSDTISFNIYFEICKRIVGNAEYSVCNTLNLATGKREYLAVIDEFGPCEGLHHAFKDLYDIYEIYEEVKQSEGTIHWGRK